MIESFARFSLLVQ
jgi:hypothetical protein